MTAPEETPPPASPEPAEAPAVYFYSLDEEVYESGGYASREGAVAAAVAEHDLEPGTVLWTGRTDPLRLEDLFDGKRFLEDVIETAGMISGEETVEPWANKIDAITDRQCEDLAGRLAHTLRYWLMDHGLPGPDKEISCIVQVEEHFVAGSASGDENETDEGPKPDEATKSEIES